MTAARLLHFTCSPLCRGKRLRPEALAVTFAGLDIADLSRLPLLQMAPLLRDAPERTTIAKQHPERAIVAQRIVEDLLSRIQVLLDLGLGYLSLDRSTPTLSPGELQRLRLATQVRSNLFGVVYVLDEPSAGLHPADTQALLRAFGQLRTAGNSLFGIEHEMDVMRAADWIVEIGPGAGEHGGRVLYSGRPAGLQLVDESQTRRYLFGEQRMPARTPRASRGWLELKRVTRHNLRGLDVRFPLGVLTTVTGVSGSGKSSLVSQALIELASERLGAAAADDEPEEELSIEDAPATSTSGRIVVGLERIERLVVVDQRPIGRTPRSNLATYTGLFGPVRKLFAATPEARRRRYDAGRFSFNVAKGRCRGRDDHYWPPPRTARESG